MLRLMAAPAAAGQIIHIGNDRDETNIGDLAKLVLRLAGASPVIEPLAAPAGSVPRRCPDLTRLRELTGYEPAVTLEEGVRSTYHWYRENGWPA
jgi:nucleoside-diphosphate-sugar epimerase